MRAKRVMGKSSFIDVEDASGKIQVRLERDTLGPVYQEFKTWDVGDIVAAQGSLFRTNAGELTVRARSLRLLTKSLRPLPDKWHGIATAVATST
jgi:lysyl-tRNA synthetase class 2